MKKEIFEKYKKFWIVGVVVLIFVGGWFVRQQKEVDNQAIFKDVTVEKNSEDNIKKDTANKDKSISAKEKSTKSEKITVDLTGAVIKEGVYRIPSDARIVDLINRAGGLRENADLRQVNRAQKLNDQDKIYIPFEGEIMDIPETKVVSANINQSRTNQVSQNNVNEDSSGKININSATVNDLMKLNGIGQKKAEQIVAFRDENGPFKETKDLTNVSGIGEKTFASLEDQITV